MKLKEAINDIKEDVLHPVYLLKGNDHYLQNFFIDKLASKYFGSSPVEKLYLLPDEMSGKDIIDNIKTFYLTEPSKIEGQGFIRPIKHM